MATEQGKGIVSLKSGRFVGFCERSAPAQDLADSLLPDPDRLFATGEPIRSPWQSASTDKAVIRLEGRHYFVKRYNCQGFGYRLRNLLRPSRALRSWSNGLHFAQAQVPTVAPVLYLEERIKGLLGRSYVIHFHLDDADSLLDCWPSLDLQEQTEVLLHLADIFGCMHRQGIFHGDLNWRNILVRKEKDILQLFLIDLDGCRYRSGYREKLAHRDLKHFCRDMSRAAVSAALTRAFRQAWQSAAMD